MLKHRIIPTLLWDGMQCVKPVSFERPYRKLGTMEQYIRVIETRNVDELIILDIEATPKGRPPNYVKLRQFCDNLYCPVTYGGGIRTLDDIRNALSNGADKVAIKTSRQLMKQAAEKFGAQCIVGVLDWTYSENYKQKLDEDLDWFHLNGVGEILLTDTLSDGQMNGYNTSLIEDVCYMSNIPVIANGGCGEPKHMLQALEAGASAVAAGSMFLYTEHTPRSCAEQLTEWGCNVRLI